MRTELVQTRTTNVPGAQLRYLTRGSGPLLLLIAGGHGDATKTEAMAAHLSDTYTVLTYDRRGLSGSTTDEPARTLAAHTEDASRLLAAVTTEPAHVYGTSFGALIALGLAARHPDQVDVVVAHEPGATNLLPEPERLAAIEDLRAVEEAFAADGTDAALRGFAERFDIDPSDGELDVEHSAPRPEQQGNFEFFATHDLPALREHVLDLGELRGSSARLVAAVGASSGHLWPHACGRLLAEGLGIACETFPGGHNGYVFRPRETAERLREVLAVS
jgi:pimeloyl-ACP methyl ester carboxylesterase